MALYNPRNPFDMAKFNEACKRLLAQDNLICLKLHRPRRTNQQNRYLHAILAYFAVEYGCSAEEAKIDFFKRTCNPELFITERIGRRGEKHRSLRSTADLTTSELTTAIERFRNYCASEMGLYIPSPDEHGHLRYIEQLISQNEEFL